MEPSAARVLAIAASGLVGLTIGSFLNVVVYRVPRGMSVVRPPSHCPACGTELRAPDNIPVASWLILRGRCRYCHAPISARYLVLELTTGVAFTAVAATLGSAWALPSLLLVVASCVAAVAIDLDGAAIPTSVIGAGVLGAVSLIVVAAAADQYGRIGWAALGGVVSGAVAAAVDRSDRGTRRAAVVAVLGWSVGWVWPPGGLALSGMTIVVCLASAAGHRRHSPLAVPAAGGRFRASGVPFPLMVTAVGAFGLLLAGAAIGPAL